MMRVGLFTDAYLPEITGVTTAVSQLRAELERLGHETYVYAPRYDRPHEEEPRTYRFRAGPVFAYKAARMAVPYSHEAAKSFARLDVVHSHTPFSLAYAAFVAAYRHGLPHVQTYHTYLSQYRHYIPRPIRPSVRITESYSAALCNRCSVITVPTRSILDELVRFGVRRPIRVLPFGPDMTVYARPATWEPRKAMAIPSDAPLVLYAGRMAEEKNLRFVLEAFAKAHETVEDVVMVWAGDGPLRAGLEEEGARLGLQGALRFPGFLDRQRLTDLYREADLFLFASKTETQGLVLAEAMAAGTPAIAVRAMGVRDVVADGVSGLLVSESIDEFAASVVEGLVNTELRARLAEGARRAAEAMSLQNCARRFAEIYEESRAAGSRPRPWRRRVRRRVR
ncbi:MAG: glycosyltransferase [Candidatus Bipolaricaulis sp.]|nr:glycosyltransferase [Candidatus Bipolaricaulis sp.]MDD5646874.1 glycosyltransferase [Candidatus Bipolaricaulis sp.]